MSEKKEFQFSWVEFNFTNLKEGESKFLSDIEKYSKTFSDMKQIKDYLISRFEIDENDLLINKNS